MAEEELEPEKLFGMMVKYNASDLHIKAGSSPIFRVATVVRRLETTPLDAARIAAFVKRIVPPRRAEQLEAKGTVDFAYSISGVGRFRVNVYRQRGSLSLAARRVLVDIPTREELHLPPGIDQIPNFESGLVLVAGATGSGKSTTLACMINEVNKKRRCHILTIEDPIEYLYRDEKAFVNQREIGIDVESWHEALKYLVRQNPDVILIGEVRDREGAETAIMAAETGHLVFGTVHAASAAGTLGRILDFFPQDRHSHIRQLLHFNLRAVIVQLLIRGAKPDIPLVPATEVMLVNPAIRKLIRQGDDTEIPNLIRSGRTEGMQDLNQSMADLVKTGMVTESEAMTRSANPEALRMILQGIQLST